MTPTDKVMTADEAKEASRIAELRAEMANTIERCAQWLEEDGNHATANAMRRALKDKP